jgi:hypothetical protein
LMLGVHSVTWMGASMWVQRCMMPSHSTWYTPSLAWNFLTLMLTLGVDGHSGMNCVNVWLRL